MLRRFTLLTVVFLIGSSLSFAQDEFVFACIHVGPIDDGGWTQAHHEACQYAEEQNPGSRMIFVENGWQNPLLDYVQEVVDQGAQLIVTTSDSFEEDTTAVAPEFPDVTFVNISSDNVATGEAPPNEGNFTTQFLVSRMIAGCAAALATESNKIGMVGPLINFEARRDQSSAYLGARYCFENFRGMSPEELEFTVVWIGYWFYIPGETLDPAEVSRQLINEGYDVLISAIDTLEPLHVVEQAYEDGDQVYYLGTDSATVCETAVPNEVCLGSQFYGWQSLYPELVANAMAGTWQQDFVWYGPDYENIHDPYLTPAGFAYGQGLTDEQQAHLDEFIQYLADNTAENTLPLWCGPLNYQDGTKLVAEGQCLPAFQLQSEGPSVWYLEQLLEGMIGASE